MKKQTHSFLVLAPNLWDETWMNRQQLMSRIGKSYPVLYSNGAFFSWDIGKALATNPIVGQFDSKDNVIVDRTSALAVRTPKLPILENFVVKYHVKRWQTELQKVAPNSKRILYIFHPSFYDYVAFCDNDILIYHCFDNFLTMDGLNDGLAIKEKELCLKADFIFTSSEKNRIRIMESYKVTEVFFLPNGVDFELFAESSDMAPKFLEIDTLQEDRVGYVGSLNDKVDFDVISFLTKKMRHIDFVFVGRCNNLTEGNLRLWEEIKSQINVKYYDRCSMAEVPSVMKNMSVNCIYYSDDTNNFSTDGYPLKLHEYLACGRPVVSSAIPAVFEFSDYVNIATSNEEWEMAILNAITAPESAPSSSGERIFIASENCWDSRTKVLMSALGIADVR